LYVLLGTTGDTHEQVGTAGQDKVLHKVENLFTSGWSADVIWTFIQSVDNDIDWDLSWAIEHGFETLYECRITRVFLAISALGVEL